MNEKIETAIVKLSDLLDEIKSQITDDGVEVASRYIDHNEAELAFEVIFLEIIEAEISLERGDLSYWVEVGKAMGLEKDSVMDGDFWEKFTNYLGRK